MNLYNLAKRLKKRPRPTRAELIIGWFWEELPQDLQEIIKALISKGITPIISDTDIEKWNKLDYRLCLYGITPSQYKSMTFNFRIYGNIGRSGITIVYPIGEEGTFNIYNSEDWLSALSKIEKNGLRLLGSPSAERFRQQWLHGIPKEYKGIRLAS